VWPISVPASAVKAMAAPLAEEEKKGNGLLVVHNPGTARMLLRGTLEAAGYEVVTAVAVRKG
jgi:predicted exporter